MSILNRDVFNEYNVDYNPVGLRNISLPNSFFTPAYAPELDINDIQSRIDAARNREALNKQGLLSLDNAGLPESDYEEFTEVAKPGFNMDFAKQLGSTALGVITGNPFIGLLARGLGALAGKGSLTGIRGGVDLRGDTGFDTFRRSTSFADFFQRRRDQEAREDAAARGLAKQQNQALQAMTSNQAYGGNQGGNGGGGVADNSNASAPGGSDTMGSFKYGGLASLFYG